jgi:hypothetical protein
MSCEQLEIGGWVKKKEEGPVVVDACAEGWKPSFEQQSTQWRQSVNKGVKGVKGITLFDQDVSSIFTEGGYVTK